MSTFHLINFGCRASQADGAALKKQLLDAGLEEVAGPEHSRVAVLNTCTVTATADAEVRQVIRRILRINPDCRIVVTGCYAQRAPQEIAQLEGVAWVVGNSHKHQVADLVKASFGGHGFQACSFGGGGFQTRPYEKAMGDVKRLVQIQQAEAAPAPTVSSPKKDMGDAAAQVLVGEIGDAFHFAPVFPDDRTRPTLKIQDGCNARCAFCIIPEVRGPSRSLTPEKAIEQVRELERTGTKEIVLSGINLGTYGKDLDRRVTFLALLERILAETAIPRLRISSIEPMDVSPELIRLVAREPRMACHFHVPLQSGCDRILRLMNRRYWAAQYAERVLAIRAQIPDCGIGADVMVGFPGETAEDHSTSLRFIKALPFTYLHIFPFSPRPGTPAAQRPEHVEAHGARARSREIRALMAEKRRAFLETQIGQTLPVLTLDETRGKGPVALSSNFLKIALPGSDVAPNSLVNAHVRRVDKDVLYGCADTRPAERKPAFAPLWTANAQSRTIALCRA